MRLAIAVLAAGRLLAEESAPPRESQLDVWGDLQDTFDLVGLKEAKRNAALAHRVTEHDSPAAERAADRLAALEASSQWGVLTKEPKAKAKSDYNPAAEAAADQLSNLEAVSTLGHFNAGPKRGALLQGKGKQESDSWGSIQHVIAAVAKQPHQFLQKRDADMCDECLANGKDYCISTEACVERGTPVCENPDDRVTAATEDGAAADDAKGPEPLQPPLQGCPTWLKEPLLVNARAMHAAMIGQNDGESEFAAGRRTGGSVRGNAESVPGVVPA